MIVVKPIRDYALKKDPLLESTICIKKIVKMGNSASGEQDAVKKQAEGGSVPMYGLVDLKGKNHRFKR